MRPTLLRCTSWQKMGQISTLLGSLFFAACSDNKADILTPAYKYPDSNGFCQAVAQASCSDAVVNGCGLANKASCQSAAQVNCLQGNLEASRRISLGQTYRGAQADGCVNTLTLAYADAIVNAQEIRDIDEICDLVFSSALSAGSGCGSKADCAPALDCFAAAANTCQVPKEVDPGFSCAAPGSICKNQPQFYCDGSNCIEKPASKQLGCSPGTNDCSNNLRCVSAPPATGSTTTTFSCESKVALNKACKVSEECDSNVCGIERNISGDANQLLRQCLVSIQLNSTAAGACTSYR